MAKLYFRYGTMHSAKTLNLLAVAHNYRAQNKRVFLIKPAIDTRTAEGIVSRAGLAAPADLVVEDDGRIPYVPAIHCILVDEAQFLSVSVVDQLRAIAVNTPVICYGLRTDFQTHLFPGSKRLLEVADTIEEIKTTCTFCNKKATCNLRILDGVPIYEGAAVQIGGDDVYRPVCWYHYRRGHVERVTP